MQLFGLVQKSYDHLTSQCLNFWQSSFVGDCDIVIGLLALARSKQGRLQKAKVI
jgi:hypothetical protein